VIDISLAAHMIVDRGRQALLGHPLRYTFDYRGLSTHRRSDPYERPGADVTLQNITMPIVIAHAENDWDIPPSHSDALFNALLAPHLPPAPTPPKSGIDDEALREYEGVLRQYEDMAIKRATLVDRVIIEGFGVVEKFGPHVSIRSQFGGHNQIGLQEGVQDVLREVFRL
jgi:abhydrolase domain-containing protein 12